MIIWAGSFPRSGSTLWRIVWHAYTGLPTYSYANDPILKGIKAVGQKRLPAHYKLMARHEADQAVYMVKTHLHPHAVDPQNKSRKMLIVRDVRDVVVSLANYTSWRKGRDFDSELQRIVDKTQWGRLCSAWQPLVKVVIRYEDLRERPRETAEQVIEALDVDVPIADRPMARFDRLHKQMPRFFRQGQVGRWREVLSDAQEAQLWANHGRKMQEFGYQR